MPRSHPARRWLSVAFGALTIAIAVSVLGPSLVQASSRAHVATGASGATGATGASIPSDDPNNYSCFGHIEKGAAESGVTGTQVEYQFACDGPITGYSIQTEPHQIQYFDQSPVVALAGVPSATDSFACNGSIPALQVNCVGSASAAFEVITGQFAIPGASICTEPRIDPLLSVTYAVATATIGGTKTAPTATATVTQYMSGPYDLGRPWGCKSDHYTGDTRLGSRPPKVELHAHA